MTTVGEQIQSANDAICENIDSLADDRALLSQNVLAQLRNLVEGVVVRLHTGKSSAEFKYEAVAPALAFVRADARFNFLGRFHKLIQKSASHYTLDGDASERLMLKYYEYLFRTRRVLTDCCETDVLANLESFPIDLDPSLKEHHGKIGDRIEAVRRSRLSSGRSDRYYIHKTRPFFTGGRIYYEVTFYPAVNKVSKSDRIIAFTDIDMTDECSAMLALENDSIVSDTLGAVPDDGSSAWSTRAMGERHGVGKDTVARIWRSRGLRPWRADAYKLSADPDFESRVVDVVGLYLNPPEAAAVFAFDEKTQVQALDRTQPSLPMVPGRAGTMPMTASGTAPWTCSPRSTSPPAKCSTTPGAATPDATCWGSSS
ncbi:MAG: hypothetical protein OXT07_14090 [bacterium]|nr:hypothetical protein [bacterium]